MSKKEPKNPEPNIQIKSPTAFEKMWSDLVQLTLNASEHSFRQDINYSHLLEIMGSLEQRYQPNVEAERKQIRLLNESQEKSNPEEKK